MQKITNEMILALAPNSTAAVNGSKISKKGGFIRLEQTADDTFFLGECKGSGKSNYITTADFIDVNQPVFRCSCPSRQFPCKHSLGLLYEMMEGKKFELSDIPEDIIQKRAKKEDRTKKAQETLNSDGKEKKTAAKKVNQAALAKKLRKQLEGLELITKMVSELLNMGLGAMGGSALNTYRQLSKQLGDYYLPGPQKLINSLILTMEKYQKDGEVTHYEDSVDVLKRLNTLVKKSRQYLNNKLESKEVLQDDNLLFEELGGIWKLAELANLGLSKENVRLIQLSFWVEYDDASKEYIDNGYWVDVDTGEVNYTKNYRPLKALKYIKQEDTIFMALQVPNICYYPGEGNQRIRWEGMTMEEVTSADLQKIRNAAVLLAPAVKAAKNTLKNTLSNPMYITLIQFSEILRCGNEMVVMDSSNKTILLGDRKDLEPTIYRLSMLPDSSLLKNHVLLGAFYYDQDTHRIRIQPLSIITPEQIVRLLY